MLMTSALGLFVLFADKFKTLYLKKLSVAMPDPTEEPEARPRTSSLLMEEVNSVGLLPPELP
ncbi:MAG TPA: hypothetical protein VHH93_04285 [Gammaproteobacteria bacterium]|nr:hypothetical protein [Gammaproteobacteria bacterium]